MNDLKNFKKIFSWHRNISLGLINQFPAEYMTDKLASQSLPLNIQFMDLGDMQVRIYEMMTGKKIQLENKPTGDCTDKEKIIAYLNECHEKVFAALEELDPETARLNWYGRMDFNFEEALAFMLAHESLHHGEILSFIMSKNVPMPQIFRDTWGFE